MNQIVDVFQCCILTWDFLPVVLPAFLIAAAIPVFISSTSVLKLLGYRARAHIAYGTAAFSGMVLSMCSCNVVPVAVSIFKRGAGIGPAFCFLYAGPAINFVTMVWVFQVVGLKMGLWRVLAVPLMGVATGLTMALLFRREDRARREEYLAAELTAPVVADLGEQPAEPRHVAWVFALLMAILMLGAKGVPVWLKLPAMLLCGGVLAARLTAWFSRDQLHDWATETWNLLKLVLPILVPAILLIGFIQTNRYTWNLIYNPIYSLMGENTLKHSMAASLFGSLMYFPILTEVALTKALLKEEMVAVGPALAILLNGPGVSLPGAILLARLFGWRMTLAYVGLEVLFGGLIAYAFGALHGAYTCPCQRGEVGTIAEDPSSLYAAVILAGCLLLAWWRAHHRPTDERTS